MKARYLQLVTDACVYYQTTTEGTVVIGTYVDDLVALATRDKLLGKFGSAIISLELKCLGLVGKLFGIRIGYNDATGCSIVRKQTMIELLHKNCLKNANTVRASISGESSLESESEKSMTLPSSKPGTAED